MIDLDPQGNSTTGVGIDKRQTNKSIYELLIGAGTIDEAIIKTKFKNLSIIPASINLAGIDIELEQSDIMPGVSKAEKLKYQIDKIKDNYDYILIDCPPALGIITTNALTASDSVIIPVQCEFFALEGITQLLKAIMYTQANLNFSLN